MKAMVEKLERLPVFRQRMETVERKGLGHPDSICDAAMEHASQALSRVYFNKFGRILHHNLDKGMLVAGRSRPRIGGGEVLKPMRFILGDRATSEFAGEVLDTASVVEEAILEWLKGNLPRIKPSQHLVFQNELNPGSAELAGIFSRDIIVANDTSAAVGYAPMSETERVVLAAEKFLNSRQFKEIFPEAGEDVKVMGYRRDRLLNLTVALAFVDSAVPDAKTYFSRKAEMQEALEAHLKGSLSALDGIATEFNTLDDPALGLAGMYLTVLGTSAEAGDCGAVGRGNKVNGIISLNRPMSMEAAAGKNAVSHVGKIYSFLTHDLAEEIYANVEGLDEVYVWLGSKIGRPVDDPAMASVQLVFSEGAALRDVDSSVRNILNKRLSDMPRFIERIMSGEFPVC